MRVHHGEPPRPYQTADGRWRVSVQQGHGSREHRNRRCLSASSYEEARRRRDELLAPQARDERPPDRRLTVGTFVRRWLGSLQLADATIESYASVMERHVLPQVGGLLLSQLSTGDLDDMLGALARKGVSASMRRRALRYLSIALNSAVRKKRLMPYNPADGADMPKVSVRRTTVLTPAEGRRLLEALASERLGPLIAVLLTTGLRRGEVLGLRWQDWDRDAGTLRIEHKLQYTPKVGYELQAPKTRKVRVIRISNTTHQALVAQAKRQAEERLAVGRRWEPNDLVFTAEHRPGGAVNGQTVLHALERICRMADVHRVRVHDLRHTAATWITEAVGIERAKEVLGHSTIAMTERYTHLEATSAEAAAAMDAALGTGSQNLREAR